MAHGLSASPGYPRPMETSSTVPVPPLDPVAPPAPLAALFSPGQIVAAALLASPLAAGVLWRMNRAALGQKRLWVPLVAGAAGLGAMTALAMAFPKFTFLPIVAAMSLRPAAQQAFPPALVDRAGRRSWWLALGITTVIFTLLLGVLLGVAVLEERAAPVVEHGAHERVFLADEALRADGEQLARALAEVGYFDGSSEASINLDAVDASGLHLSAGYNEHVARAEQRTWADAASRALAGVLDRCVEVRTVTLIGTESIALGETEGVTVRHCPGDAED